MNCALLSLGRFDLIRVQGKDARKFLQGQVSCDVDQLGPHQSLAGALCNLKGRVIADFRLLQTGDDCYLQLEPGMGQVVKAVLDKYIIFSKATTSLISERFARFGLMGHQAHHLIATMLGSSPMADGNVVRHENLLAIKIPGFLPRFELWIDLPHDQQPADQLINQLQQTASKATDEDWNLEDIRAGIVHIGPSMSETYLPQQLNYDISGVINFKKGCYTGQEIVARMYYRSSNKKRLYHLLCEAQECACQNQISVYYLDGESQQACEVLTCQNDREGHCHLLAILPAEAVDAGRNFYPGNQPDAILRPQPLPYLPLHQG